jgi:bacteriocin-like protein
MSNDQPEDKVKTETKTSSADDLTKTSQSGDIELDEEELKRVSGGIKGESGDYPHEDT